MLRLVTADAAVDIFSGFLLLLALSGLLLRSFRQRVRLVCEVQFCFF